MVGQELQAFRFQFAFLISGIVPVKGAVRSAERTEQKTVKMVRAMPPIAQEVVLAAHA